MTSLRWRYAWRQLWLNKTRSLLVILSIAVGVFAFAIIWGAAITLRREVPANFEAIHPASAILHTTFFDDAMVEAIDHMPEVAVAEGRQKALVRYRDAEGEWHDMELFSLADFENNKVNIVRPYRGA